MDLYRFCYLLIIFITAACQPIKISTNMPQQTNITEPPNYIDVTLKPLEGFVYHTDFLQPLDYFSDNCHSIRGELVEQVLASFPNANNADNYQHVYSEKYGIIYRLQHQNLLAYTYSNVTHKLEFIERLDFRNSHCQATILLSQDQQFLYHFSCEKVTKIEMKKSFAGITNAYQDEQRFYGFKIASGRGFFVWASYSQGVKVYSIEKSYNLQISQNLTKFPQKIVDISIYGNRLYLLGLEQNIYIYELLGTGKYQSKANISLSSLCQNCKNRQILVHKQNIFISSKINNQQFITEIQATKQVEHVELVRYYKGRRYFVSMDIFNGKLLAAYQIFLNLYEINRDPRTIKRLNTGITNTHFQRMIKLQRISEHLFVKQTDSTTTILRLSIKTPYIECNYNKSHSQVEKLEIVQPCRLEQNKIYNENNYSISCISKDIISIKVMDEGGAYKHLFAVVSVFVFCSLVVAVLVIWRKSKMDVIENIVIEINKFKKRRKEDQVEFVEEKAPTRQSNWNGLHESQHIQRKYDDQHSYQYEDQKQPQHKAQQVYESNTKQNQKQAPTTKKQHIQLNQQVQIHEEQEIEGNIQGTQRNMITRT